MARELNRIKINVEKSKPHKLYFLLRSGFLLSEFFNYPSIKKEIINPKFFNEDLKEGYIIDDCVVMARSLKKLNLKKDSRFTLSVLDCAMPKRIYEKDIRINILKNLYQLKMNGKLNYEECLEEFKKSLEGGSEFDILIEGIIKNISTNRIRWFDVGIGDGHYLKKIVTILEKKGFVVEVNGIDNDEKSVREAISVFPDGKILQGDFLKIDKSRRCNNALQTKGLKTKNTYIYSMIKLLFKKLIRQYPDEAKEFLAEQEMLVLVFNSPKRDLFLKDLKLSSANKKNVDAVIEDYAQCKIKAEKKMKSRAREDIIKVENNCLKKMFEGHILKVKIKGTKKKAVAIGKKIIMNKFPSATILDEKRMAFLAKKVGLKKKFPTDFLVFDGKKKKVISFGIVMK